MTNSLTWILLLGVCKPKLINKSNSRKSKSPITGQGYLGTECPSSVSSVHSEGDYHRQPPGWAWEDRPSSTGSTQFPYNPLTMRMLSSTPPTPITCAPSAVNQTAPHQQNRIWEREPAPLLSAQYETLSDSDDWAVQQRDWGHARGALALVILTADQKSALLWFVPRDFSEQGPWMKKKWWKFIWKVKWEKNKNCLQYRQFSDCDLVECWSVEFFKKWTIPVLTSICKENHNVFKSLFCK